MGWMKNKIKMKKPVQNKISHNMFKNGLKIWKPIEQYTIQTVNQDLLNGSFTFNYTVFSNNTNHWAKSTTESFPNCFVACSYPPTFTDYLHIYLKKVTTIPDNAIISKMTLTMSRSKAEWGPTIQDRIVRFDQNNIAKNNLALININYPSRTSNPKSVTNSYGGDISSWGLDSLQNKDLPNLRLTFQAGEGSNTCEFLSYIMLAIEFLIPK